VSRRLVQRWLYITPTTLHLRGGQSTHVLEFCQALVRKVELTLLAPAEPDFVAPNGVCHMPINLPPRGKGIVFEWQLLRALVAQFAASNTLPDVVYVRAGIFQLSALLFARRYRLPCLLEINGDLVAEYPNEYPPTTSLQRLLMTLRLAVYRASLRTSYRAADGLIVVTPDLRLAMIRDDAANETVVLREGMSLEGEQAAWRLDSIDPRQVNFISVDGRESLLELSVNTSSLAAGSSGLSSRGEDQNPAPGQGDDQSQPTDPEVSQQSEARARAEEVRRRVAERRAELRAEAERRARLQQQQRDN